ncbi:hypothetical protein [Barnesiella intestinihominis]|uniref:hypothetical protein n=1 Tax=Barnesiella intestinihominis TaxID=487174 RepID=UPI00396787C5
MRNKILIIMGIIMLIGFITIGFFIFPIGITLCSIIGLCYGITGKDKLFTRWSFIGLSVGIIFLIYTYYVIQGM